jgi:hypothetical protein
LLELVLAATYFHVGFWGGIEKVIRIPKHEI